jgi:hypothetical protein
MGRSPVPPPPTRFPAAAGVQAKPAARLVPPVPVPGRRSPPLQAKAAPAPVRRAAPTPPRSSGWPALSTVVQRASSSVFSSTVANEAGQIYGIWKNEQAPGKIASSSLSDAKCLYVGKTARGEDLGGRFVEHVKNDDWAPWCIDFGMDYSDENDDRWPYVVRNIWTFNGITKFDVAAAEQFYIQEYARKGASLLNDVNAISLKKFAEHKDSGSFTTMSGYPKGWKPSDFKK